VRKLTIARASKEQIEEFYRGLKEQIPDMLSRAQDIKVWMDTKQMDKWVWEDDSVLRLKWSERNSKKKRDEFLETERASDAYKGLRWAMAIDPEQTSNTKNIAQWGPTRIITHDGGRVGIRNDKNLYILGKPTEQAVQALFAEAQARGWDTIKLKGNKEFCKIAAEVANQYSINAVVTDTSIAGFFKKPQIFHGALPASPRPKQIEHDQSAPLERSDPNAALVDPKDRSTRIYEDDSPAGRSDDAQDSQGGGKTKTAPRKPETAGPEPDKEANPSSDTLEPDF
jgi:hypothetical protein